MFPEPGTIPVNEFDELQVAPLSKEYSHEQPEGDDEIVGEVVVAVVVVVAAFDMVLLFLFRCYSC